MLENLISLSDTITTVSATAGETGTAMEKLGLGASVAVMGLAVVFLGLISLIIIMIVYPKIVNAFIAKPSVKKAKASSVKVPVAVQKTTASAAVGKPAENDALIAVITASIAASLGTSANGIVIKSIERTGKNVPAWGARGRIEQVYNRF